MTAVNGRVFAAYIKEIVNHLNLNETIYLTDTFTASIKIVAFETLEMVNLKYTDEMNKLVYPFDWKRFNVFEANLNEKCVKHLKLNIIGNIMSQMNSSNIIDTKVNLTIKIYSKLFY